MKLLVVEDDAALGESLDERLCREGYEVALATGVREAETALKVCRPDLAIVDVGLPDGDGFSLGRILKEKSIPLVFLTAMNSAEYRLEGFEIGADDYIPKPFHMKELLLRVKRVLDTKRLASKIMLTAKISLNLDSGCIEEEDKIYNLGVREAELLGLLVSRAPKILSRDDIANQVWKDSKNFRTVDNAVVRVRQGLREFNISDSLESVRGYGYRWAK